MKIPDLISPVVGCRVWQWDSNGIRSLNGETWLPQRRLTAACRASTFGIIVDCAEAAHGAHDAPRMDCTCGVYAARDIEHLRTMGYTQYGICGEVYLWGTVVEHELGWRAQHACPKSFLIPLEVLPISMGMLESRLSTLVAYGCDIHVLGEEGNVPLWISGSGFDPAGLDYVIERSRRYHDRRRRERTLKKGDRVAILGRGIAVVEHMNDKQVCVLLWNRNVLRLSRKEIVWDEGNMRWESCGGLNRQ